jgi:hypothetical protein
MAFTESWIESDPDGAVITGSLLDDYQRQSKRAIRERLEGDPANPNSGIYEAASFGATAIVRAGTARAYAVTAAGVAALTLQDGRMAITTDTKRLFHLKATGAVEIGYLPLNAAGDVDSLGYHLSGNGAYASAKMYKDAVNGLILSGTTGSSYDLVLTNNVGSPVIRILTGTTNVTCPGTFTSVDMVATNSIQSGYFYSPGAAASAGFVRVRNGDTFQWRNAANSGDINAIAMSGTALRLQGESSITLNQNTTVNGFMSVPNGGNVAASGTIRLSNGQGLNWRNSTNAGDIAVLYTTGTKTVLGNEVSTEIHVLGVSKVVVDANGLGAIALYSLDDQNQKLTIGRYSAGIPSSYIKIAAASTNGLRITNAAGVTDVMIMDNAGNVSFSGTGAFTGGVSLGGAADISGAAAAVAAGHLSIGGNTSTVANTYGGGGVSALPAQPAGYLPIYLGATNYKVPYYPA